MKNRALCLSIVLLFFLLLATVCATDINNASITEGSNLTNDNDYSLSKENLEISNEDSISKTNIVNSHDDNLSNYPVDDSLKLNDDSYYEDNGGNIKASNTGDINTVETISSINGSVISSSSPTSDIKTATNTPVSTKLSVSDTHYDKSATYFKVTLQDKDGKSINNQKISLTVNGKTYTGFTDNGVVLIKTTALAIGSYNVVISYAGNTNYSASSLSKKVKVLSSVSGSDMTKYYGYTSKYKVTFWKDNNVLANTKVSFKVNGKTYTKTTDKNGVATLNINLAVGKYVITTTNPYSKEKMSKNIVVKKDSTKTSGASKTYIIPKNKYSFTVTVKSKHDVSLKNAKVTFTYNHKKVTARTNSDGKATITIPVLSKGTYKITYKYSGSIRYKASSGSGYLYVKNPTTKLTSSALKMGYNDGSKFSVKLKNTAGKALANKTIKIKINGKTSSYKTGSNGVAKLPIGNLKPGNYKVSYSYSTKGLRSYNYGSNSVVISKLSAKLSANNLNMKYKDGSVYKATVKDSKGNVLKDVGVKFTVNGKSYTYKTDANGVAKFTVGLGVGYYPIKSVVSDSYYQSNTVSKNVLVNGTKFIADDYYVNVGSSASYSVKLVDGKSNPIKNANVIFKFNNKNYTQRTDSNGVAKLSLGVLSKGDYTIKFAHGSYSDSAKIYVVSKATIKQIISSSKSVKKYIESNGKLPSTVKVGDVTYSTAQYLYLVSKAIVNLKAGKKSDIAIKDVDDPTSPKSASNLGNLYDYLSVAKSIVSTSESKGVMPNSVSSKVGTIGYNGVVYAFARVVAFYGDNSKLPSYVAIKSTSTSSLSSSLNSKNTISNLVAYLAASTNCQVNNTKIKELVTKLTKSCKTDKEKATAIYNYVRDTLSYSFYYNTKYGAVGTLNAKTGNCVDHSHLLVAMYRTAGLAARYVHGTCTFTSGSTYGHVWVQVLIGNTWTVSDATSSKNSLGKVASWNTNTYNLKGYYASISF